MLEVLVTLGIITVWLLAAAGVQFTSAKLNKTAQLRTEAIVLAADLAERMEANRQSAANGNYVCTGTDNECTLTDTPSGCLSAPCLGPDRATFDKAEWGNRVAAMLPGASAKITYAAGTPATYEITIRWNDRRDNRTYEDTSINYDKISYTTTRAVLFDPGG